MSESFQEKHVWKVLEAYFRRNSIVANQIDTFDNFINFGMQEIIDQERIIAVPNYTVEFGQISLAQPQVIEEDRTLCSIYPMDARRKDLNYDAAIHCDITETISDGDTKEKKHHSRVVIGRMPIMLKCSSCNLSKLSAAEQIQHGECASDPGGYFIIKGNERVIVGQMRANYNHVFVLKQKPESKYKWIAETRSMSNETGHSVLLQALIGSDDRTLQFSLPYIKEYIPVGVVFKSLGYTNEEDIVNLLGLDHPQALKYVRFILRDSFFCQTKEDALKYIGEFAMHVITDDKKSDYAFQVVETELLPHFGISGTIREQACFLGHMIRKLILTSIGFRGEDDRDNYANKRVEAAGTLFYDIFRNLFKKYCIFIKTQLEKRKQPTGVLAIISSIKSITKGLHQCLSTGNWGVQKNASYVRTGVSQILDRMTYCASLSHLRRVVIPVGKEGKNTAMRQIHGSSFGMCCPCECFDPNTPILTWNGTVKKARDIVVGDILIDDKGNKTRVRTTCFGTKEMYEVRHTNKNFENYTVTDNHILTLKATLHGQIIRAENVFRVITFDKVALRYRYHDFSTESEAQEYKVPEDNIVDLTIEKYLFIPEDISVTLQAFKCPNVNWPKRKVEINPYLLGMQLGDGFVKGLTNDKKIPREYLINSRNIRLRVLAGLRAANKGPIETCHATNDMVFLIRSLGFVCEVGTELAIHMAPQSPIQLVQKKIEPFVGWQLEGNGRFLLGDFTVTHNTPEGLKIGTVLNFSLLTKITRKIPTINVRRVLEGCRTISWTKDIQLKNIKDLIPIFLNGVIIGFAEDSDETVREIKEMRFKGLLDKEVSVTYDVVDNDIRIFCDEGRFSRPLLSVEGQKLLISGEKKYKWGNLIKTGQVQFLDASEIENCVIAMYPDMLTKQRNDYCEIHPSTMLGIMAAMIPFPDHNQSPRNCYQCLWVEEEVIMADFTRKRIADIRVGDSVITVDPDTCVQKVARIVNQYVRSTDKTIVKVRTISGRSLVSTDDHPVLTLHGWKKAGSLTSADTICVCPMEEDNVRETEYIKFLQTTEGVNTRTYKEWCQMTTVRDRSIFVPVQSVIRQENVMIADITTDSEPHSFVTGQGICVHNSSMGKQALGIPAYSHNLRTDTLLHVLQYPQKPIVFTKAAEILGVNEMPSGINAVVAIMCWTGLTY
jgi:DNA-directed RNA polymerase beta subunit